jgi:hypothetical protein
MPCSKPPCLPYIGYVLSDLVFIADASPNRLGAMVNYRKYRTVATVLAELRSYQVCRRDACWSFPFWLPCTPRGGVDDKGARLSIVPHRKRDTRSSRSRPWPTTSLRRRCLATRLGMAVPPQTSLMAAGAPVPIQAVWR